MTFGKKVRSGQLLDIVRHFDIGHLAFDIFLCEKCDVTKENGLLVAFPHGYMMSMRSIMGK